MKRRFNGFQCEACNTVYASEERAKTCEEKPMEKPLLKIGDTIIDDSFEIEHEMRVCKISFDGHQVNYRMEWRGTEEKEEWREAYTIFGNEMLDGYTWEENQDVK